ALIAVQLAFALALVIGSVAMLKSYVHLAEANVGFNPTNTLVIDLSLPGLDYRRYADVARFYSEVAARARRLPGVRSAEVAGGSLPLAPAEMSLFVRGDADTPTSLLPALGRIVRELDPHVPISRPRMLADVVAGSIARARLTMLLLLVAASATLALGIIGIYGVTSY